jgi:hypothetical protein
METNKKFKTIFGTMNKFHDSLLKIFSYIIGKEQDTNPDNKQEINITNIEIETIKKLFKIKKAEKSNDIYPAGYDSSLVSKKLS